MGQFSNGICRCWSNHKSISPVGKINMLGADIGSRILVSSPQIRKDRISGKRRECERRNKTRRRIGHHDLHFGPRFHELPHEICGFVCRNSARNADENMFAVEARHSYSSAGVSLILWFLLFFYLSTGNRSALYIDRRFFFLSTHPDASSVAFGRFSNSRLILS